MSRRLLKPAGWPRPSGYSHGVVAEGRLVFVAGQVGWDSAGRFPSRCFLQQSRLALGNVLAVLAEAGLGAEHIVRLTWYVTDIDAYRRQRGELGRIYRELMGDHYPPMTLVGVTALLEPEAVVEIEATAVG